MTKTKIEWADRVWNPVTGCTKISEGCRNCYAETFAERWRGVPGHPYEQGFDLKLWPDRLKLPLRWKKPQRIFVNSMSDLFHKKVPDKFVVEVFQVMADSPRHTYQVLTKRPERMAQWFRKHYRADIFDRVKRGGYYHKRSRLYLRKKTCTECSYYFLGCLNGREKWEDEAITPNFITAPDGDNDYWGDSRSWCDAFKWAPCGHSHGVAVEMNNHDICVKEGDLVGPFPSPLKNVWIGTSVESRDALRRVDELRKCPAAVRFISIEPLLSDLGKLSLNGIDWVIVGGESGSKARPMHPDWARSIRDQCAAAGVPFFFKQWGTWRDGIRIGKKKAGRLLDGCEHNEFPLFQRGRG